MKVLLFGALVACAAAGCQSEKDVEVEVSRSEAPHVEITAWELYGAYDANGVAADAKYKGKVLKVTGVVESIGKDILDTPYISIKGTKDPEGFSAGDVQCMFDEAHAGELAEVSKGETVSIVGKCDGYLMNVILRGCRVVGR